MIKNEDGTVTITLKAFEQFVADQHMLYRLHAAGVDNWEGYPGNDDDDESYEDIYGDE